MIWCTLSTRQRIAVDDLSLRSLRDGDNDGWSRWRGGGEAQNHPTLRSLVTKLSSSQDCILDGLAEDAFKQLLHLVLRGVEMGGFVRRGADEQIALSTIVLGLMIRHHLSQQLLSGL